MRLPSCLVGVLVLAISTSALAQQSPAQPVTPGTLPPGTAEAGKDGVKPGASWSENAKSEGSANGKSGKTSAKSTSKGGSTTGSKAGKSTGSAPAPQAATKADGQAGKP
jgi:hypothetical protein